MSDAGQNQSRQPRKQDIRMYFGILLFRWHVIVLCFLYSLLGAVLYINLAQKKYLTCCKIMAYRDPLLVLQGHGKEWTSMGFHRYLITSRQIRERAARILRPEWAGRDGQFRDFEDMILPVRVSGERGFASLMNVSVVSPHREYAEAFLAELIEQHRSEWKDVQAQHISNAERSLDDELDRLKREIAASEKELIEHQRLYDVARVNARSTMEARYLEALMARRAALTTELLLIEAKNPELEKANASVISQVRRLMADTGAVRPVDEEQEPDGELGDEAEPALRADELPPALVGEGADNQDTEEVRGYRKLRVQLASLQEKERELAQVLQPDHPRLHDTRAKINRVRKELDFAARVEFSMLKDRRDALMIIIRALETAEEEWKGSNLEASKQRSELKRIADRVARFEDNYKTLYARLHDMRVDEALKSEHFRVHELPLSDQAPVWPDVSKILVMCIVLGLGGGLGLAVVAQVFDNKVQTIADIEEEIGAPFLGGVPYWVHAGLEKTVRPIVTEEHSSGAVEAYRSVRTSLLSALARENEKIVLVTSADSREGKTLTVLNLAIMIAEMGKRVLLVDFDLRRGRLHRALGSDRDPGMTDVLFGHAALKDVVADTRIPGLRFAPCGKPSQNTAERLQAIDLNEMFMDLQDDYDYIFWDMPPVLRITDSAIVAGKKVGVVVYVTRVNHTPKPLIRYSLDMLKEARILGFVLNSIEMHRISSLYYAYQYPSYAYYSNAYRYGYDYYYTYGYGEYGDRRHGRHRGPFEKAMHNAREWFRQTFMSTG